MTTKKKAAAKPKARAGESNARFVRRFLKNVGTAEVTAEDIARFTNIFSAPCPRSNDIKPGNDDFAYNVAAHPVDRTKAVFVGMHDGGHLRDAVSNFLRNRSLASMEAVINWMWRMGVKGVNVEEKRNENP